MFCALCLEKSKELKTIDQQHRDILAKISIAITSKGQHQWICTVCEEDIKLRQNNQAMQSESKQLNEFLSELKENLCQSPTKSSINMLLMQTQETKQLNELLNEIQGNLCKSPRKYIAADGNHDEELKIEKIEIDDTEEFLLEQEQQYVEVQENPTANDAHIICKKLYTIADDDCAAMETEDVPSQEFIEKEQFSLSKYTISDQPFKLSAFGAKFSSDTAATENEFEDNADGLMPSPSAVYSNVERNTMLPSSFTANSNELQNCTILQTKHINLNSTVELPPNAGSMAPSQTKQTIANFAPQDKSSSIEDGLTNVSAEFLNNVAKSNLAASKSNLNHDQKDKSSMAASKSNQTIANFAQKDKSSRAADILMNASAQIIPNTENSDLVASKSNQNHVQKDKSSMAADCLSNSTFESIQNATKSNLTASRFNQKVEHFAPKDKSTAESVENVEKSIQNRGQSILSPKKSCQNPEKSFQSPNKSVQNADNSIQNADKSVQTPNESIQNPNISSQNPENSFQNPNKSSQDSEKSFQSSNKSIQNAEKSIQNSNKSSQNPKNDIAAFTSIHNNEQCSNSMAPPIVNMATEQSTISTLKSNSLSATKNSQNFKRHFQKVGKTFRCKLCSKSKKFSKISDIKEHIEFEHTDLGYQLCTECDRIFETKSRLEEHYKRRHNNMKQPLKLKTAVHKKSDSKIKKQNLQHSQISDDVATDENLDKQQENTISISDKTTNENKISSSSNVNSPQTQNNTLISTSPQNSSSKSILKIRVKQLSLDAWLKTTNKAEQQKSTGPKEAQSSQASKKLSLVDWLKTPKKAEQQKSTNPKETQSSQAVKKCKRPRSPNRADSISSQQSPVKRKAALNKKNTKSPQSNSAADQINSISPQSNTTEPNTPAKQLSSASNEKTILLQPTFENDKFKFKNKYKKVGNLYCCVSCSHKSKTHEALFAHIKSQHYGYRYFCNYCDIYFANKCSVGRHCKSVHKKEHSDPIILRIPKPEELKKPPQFSFDNEIKKINNFYVCTECSQKYKKKQALRDHIKTKHYGYRYFCNYCDAQSTQKVHLQTHCKSVHKKEHSDPISFRIPKPEELKEPPQFNFDNWIKRINDFYVCTKCSQQYKSSGPLRNHIKSKHYGYRYFCNYCDAQCTQKTHLQTHCRGVHKKEHSSPLIFRKLTPEELKKPPQFSIDNKIKKIDDFYVCTECSQKYKKQQPLRGHIKSQHYGYRYFCNYCNNNFVNKWSVGRHCKSVHKKEHSDPISFRIPKSEELKEPEEIYFDNAWKKINNYYVCSLCPAESAMKATTTFKLRLHIKIHHYNYRYYCSECDANYSTASALKPHYKKQHNISDGIIKCQKPKSTDTPIAIRTKTYKPMKHYDYTNKYKKVGNHYICTVCKNSKKKYLNAPHIQRHIKLDHYGYKYICKKCNMSWYGINVIKSHNLKVHNVKGGPFIFARTKQPRRYTKTKIDFSNTYKKNAEKSYDCLLCNAAPFPFAASVARHIKVEHYGYRYKCAKCPVQLFSRGPLEIHYRRAHRINKGSIIFERVARKATHKIKFKD